MLRENFSNNLHLIKFGVHKKLTYVQGKSAMDKAVTCQAGGRGSNPDTSKDFKPSWVPATHSLSLTMPVITCSSVNTCQGKVKREEL